MTLEVIGAGWGRTATNSLKLALEQLGFGVCHHMWEVVLDQDRLLPLWNAALDGTPDWPAVFTGNRCAVDWPVAGFWRELAEYYPDAKIILTTRSAESWYKSFSETILKMTADPESRPEPKRPVARMARRVVTRSTGEDFSPEALMARFRAHEADVKESLPSKRLLVFSPSEGWAPLCEFLGQPIPDTPFPRSNARDEFLATVESIK